MKIRKLALSKIEPYANNPRRNKKAIAKVADSIEEFGFRQPIVVDESFVVLAGHTRLEAARKLKLKTVPVHVAEGLTESQKRAYRIMDNRSAEEATWNPELLSVEMSDLLEDGYDLALTGFNSNEIDQLLLFDDDDGLDDIPEEPEPIVKPGELWILGNHRLKCGDATSATDVEHLLGDIKPHLMVTDPPYGVAYEAEWRNKALREDGKRIGARATGKVSNDQNADWSEAWALFPGDVAYVWHAGIYAGLVANSLTENGFQIRSQIIWSKNNIVVGRGHYHWKHEPCWYAVRKKGHWSGSRKESTVWNIDKPMKSETGHSTQKPVECMRRPIMNNSSPGQAVYDPFLGSGTTIIAAEKEGRHCYGLELEPKYCDVIIARWEQMTGEKAVRDDA